MATTTVTLLNIVNKILVRLRESELSSLTEAEYAKQLVEFINSAKREVEDAYNWDALNQVVDVDTVASTNTVSVVDGGFTTNPRTRIMEVYNSTTDCYLRKTSQRNIRRWQYDDTNEQEPTWYSLDGLDANQDIQLALHQTPDQVYTLKVACYNPQEDFDVNDGSDTLTVPWYPIFLRALTLAIRERGDDKGLVFEEAYREYQAAITDAIAYEQRHHWEGDSFPRDDWYVP